MSERLGQGDDQVVHRPIESLYGQSYFLRTFPIFINRGREAFSLQEHAHDFIEIAYVAEGRGFHYIDNQVVAVNKGDLFYIPVGTSHVFRPAEAKDKEMLVVSNCIFTRELFERILAMYQMMLPAEQTELLQELCNRTVWHRANGHLTSDVGDLMQRLHQEYRSRRKGRQMMIFAYVQQLLLLVSRSVETEQPQVTYGTDTRADIALTYIRQHIAGALTLADAAASINVGERQFDRLIRKWTGQTFTDFVQSLRIDRCCELLRTTDQKVYEIAEASGFKDRKHFHTLFRRKTGMSPGAYRNNVAKGEE